MNSTDAPAIDYSTCVVNKPWGYEYLMYANDLIGLWYLHLDPGASTSLHCHPKKKTGLVVLDGEGELHFLNGGQMLRPLSRVIIRPGLFHSTHATGDNGITLLEVETPRDKENLVRLEDCYGRASKPYEGREAFRPAGEDCLHFKTPPVGRTVSHELAGCRLSVLRAENVAEINLPTGRPNLMILDGGMTSADGEYVLGPGDVVTPTTLHRLARCFSTPEGISLLIIERP